MTARRSLARAGRPARPARRPPRERSSPLAALEVAQRSCCSSRSHRGLARGMRSLQAVFAFVTAVTSCKLAPVRLPRLRISPFTLLYFLVAILASAPAWIVKHPPMQDLPLHLATIRIVKSFHDPAFGFSDYFVLTLDRTQYVVYYLLGAALAFFVGVVAANVLLVSFYLG